MNAKKARALRRMASEEMANDKGVVDRELVIARIHGKDRVINEPNSVRAMNNALKKAYKKSTRNQS